MLATRFVPTSFLGRVTFARAFVALVLTGLLLAGAGIGRADAASSGQLGRFTPPSAGVCNYGSSHIFSVRVPAPQVFARDATGGVDIQKVGYVVDLVRLNADGSITNVKKGPSQFATASETQAASFAPHTFEGVRNLGPGIYAVSVTFSWFQIANPQLVEGIHQQLLGTYKLTQIRSNAAPLLIQTVDGGCPSLRPW